jgi:uncharacterized protein YprB with RNaseH-like and TPR domain
MEHRLRMLRRSLQARDMAAASELLKNVPGAAAPGAAAPAQVPATGLAVGPGRVHAKAVPLPVACEGVETAGGKGDKFWLIRRELGGKDSPPLVLATSDEGEDFHPRLSALPKQYAAIIRGARQRWDELEASAALCRAADGNPEDLLFMDIESCGLAPAPVFLIGLMTFADGQFRFEQFLARDYSEERAILEAFAQRLPSAGVLVTFNGKSFDMNMLRQRSAFHGVEMPSRVAHHLDLLHESRKRWKRTLPNCRLQTLEQCLCGRRRVGDIPGWQIAEAYHSFVRSGDARPIGAIVHHNLLDLLTMGELVCHLLSGAAPA